jgi:hypothetical protein
MPRGDGTGPQGQGSGTGRGERLPDGGVVDAAVLQQAPAETVFARTVGKK